MKIIRIIKKSIRDAFKSVFRNFSLSAASISCTAITLILVSISLLVTYNVNDMTEKFENDLTIVVSIDSTATKKEIEDLIYNVNSIANVNERETKYISSEEIKKEKMTDEKFKNIISQLKDNENPFSHKLVIKVKNAKKIDDTAEKISKFNKIKNLDYGENVVDKVVSLFGILRNGCVMAVIALIIVTAFLIGNTIKIAIFSRRNEINIMRLVGTSNTVIKLPFIIEGLILGIIGAIIPVLITVYGYMFLYDYIGGKIAFANLVEPKLIVYEISLVLLLVGGIVGMFGSLRAVKRYLKV